MNGTKKILLVAVLATSTLGASAAPVAARNCVGFINSTKAHSAGSNSRRALARNNGTLTRAAARQTDIFSAQCKALADALGIDLP
jgi:hypothetical protein